MLHLHYKHQSSREVKSLLYECSETRKCTVGTAGSFQFKVVVALAVTQRVEG